MMRLRNGTYLREPDGATRIYFSPHRFTDAAENFRKRELYDDSWQPAKEDEVAELWNIAKLQPGEFIFIRMGEVR